MGSRPGLRVVKVMRPEFSARVFDVIRPADGRYNRLTQQRGDGREGGVSLRGVDGTRPMGMPGVGHVMSSHPRL